jgi:hypothetical protein
MNKSIKTIIALWAVILVATGISSCKKDFLNEELKTQRNFDYFKTPDGITDLSLGLYNYYRYIFSGHGEQGISTCQYGTDEFDVGNDNSNHDWNDYTSNLAPTVLQTTNSNITLMNEIWDNMYKAISDANLLLANVDEAVTDPAKNAQYKAEASFLRAVSYFRLVQQYGGVVLKLLPSNGVERFFVRASKEECVSQIIADLRTAYAGLPAAEAKEGMLYKDVAAHFLAKVLLYRVSEINNDWNSSYKTADLAEIITLADEVIAHHPLASDFSDIFAFTTPDGANEKLPEVIFAAQFSGTTTSVEGMYLHLLYLSQYNNLTGFVRDIAGGREYQRARTSDFIYDVFDMENDSRFWKSFRTKLNLNNAGTVAQLNGTDPNTGTAVTYANFNLGLIYIINKQTDTRFNKSTPLVNSKHTGVYYLNPNTGKPTPDTYVRYYSDGTPHLRLLSNNNRFPPLNKYIDGSRSGITITAGRRDGILARSAETYFIKAEALIRKGLYADAINVINVVRGRAQFKANENRAAYKDGAAAVLTNSNAPKNADGTLINSYTPFNSYYESLDIPVSTAATDITTGITYTSLPAVDEAIITKLGYTTDYDRMMCFLLNERTRELCGELFRWEDLARTKTLLKRAKTYNPAAAPNIEEKHYLRPIPQTFLDAIYNAEGKALTAEEKTAMQNPGY